MQYFLTLRCQFEDNVLKIKLKKFILIILLIDINVKKVDVIFFIVL
jgi:hypothetical protein